MSRAVDLLPRWVHRRYAQSHRYFWLLCPTCGRYFGGHEWMRSTTALAAHIPTNEPGRYEGICPKCTRAGKGSWK